MSSDDSRTSEMPRASIDNRAAPARRSRQGHPWLTLVTVALGVIMFTLDSTVVAIANPAIGRDLGASFSDLQWVTSGYLLAIAVFLITAGKLGDVFGHKNIFLIGVVGFAASSAAIGLSRGIGLVIAFRVLQGMFGAMLQPTSLGLLRAAFPAEKLNMAIGVWGSCIGLATAAGPIVGGLLVGDNDNWELVFFINVPVGLLALVLAFLYLRNSDDRETSSSFDVPGILVLSAALFSLVFAVIKAPDWGWGDPLTLGLFALALVLLVAFVMRERYAREPLLPLGLFRSRSLSAGTVIMLLTAFSMFGAFFFLTFYLQGVHGLSPVETGVRLLPLMVAWAFSSPISGILISKLGPRIPIMGGLVLAGVSFFGMLQLGENASAWTSSFWFVVLGLGLSPVFVGATDIIVGNAPVRLAGVAGGLQQVAMQIGGALGTSVLGALMTARIVSVAPGHAKDAGLPPFTDAQLDAIKEPISAGISPIPAGTPAQVAQAIEKMAHLSFIDGMHLVFIVSGAVAFLAALIGLIVKKGEKTEESVGSVGAL